MVFCLGTQSVIISNFIRTFQIQDLSFLSDLKNLQSLYLSRNQIQDLSFLSELKNLHSLDLNSNQIQDLSFLSELKNLQGLDLRENPFLAKVPEEIQRKSDLDILQYWLDTHGQKRAAMPVREAKVVFVGEGGSGKTSLIHLLLNGKKIETKRTEKIEIHSNTTLFTYGKKQEVLTLRFWDFGGQDIMHATHKFFMSERTLYVLDLLLNISS